MIKKVEVLANIAVIVASLVLSSVLVKKYFFPGGSTIALTAPTPQPPPVFARGPKSPPIKLGAKIVLPGLDWSKSSRTILLALSTKCRFCTESAPFYQQILQKKSTDVQVVAVLPQPVEDSRKYLDELGVQLREVVQAGLTTVGVSGTPTVILIDRNGVVQNTWIGKLSADDVQSVLELIGKK